MDKLLEALRRAASGKAPGPDRLPADLLKALSEDAQKDYLQSLLDSTLGPGWEQASPDNCSFTDSNQWPNVFMRVYIALLVKPGAPLDVLNARRPIGLACRPVILTQVAVEPALAMLVDAFVGDSQFAFKAGHTTHMPVSIILALISRAHSTKTPLCILYLDFADAYTTVIMEMWLMLIAHLGAHRTVVEYYTRLCHFVLSYLTWHGPSDFFKQLIGFIQGSIFGCSGFNLWVEVLGRLLDTIEGAGVSLGPGLTVYRLLYAYDLTVPAATPQDLQTKVIPVLERWLQVTKMVAKFKAHVKTAYSSLRFDEDGHPCDDTTQVYTQLPGLDDSGFPIPRVPIADTHDVVGYPVSLGGSTAGHHARMDKKAKSTFMSLRSARIKDHDYALVQNAFSNGIAQSGCLVTQTMEKNDRRCIPSRQAYRASTNETIGSPRLLFYDTRGWVHWHASEQAALLRLVMGWLNLARSHLVYRVLMNDLVFTLLSAGLLVCPFTQPLPPMAPFACCLSFTPAGRWLMAMQPAKWSPHPCLPMQEVSGYIRSHFPSGLHPLWLIPSVMEACLLRPCYPRAGILYLTDVITQDNSLLSYRAYCLRNQGTSLREGQYTRLIEGLRVLQVNGTLPSPAFRFATPHHYEKCYTFPKGAFLMIPVGNGPARPGSDRDFWLVRVPLTAPPRGWIMLQWWEQPAYHLHPSHRPPAPHHASRHQAHAPPRRRPPAGGAITSPTRASPLRSGTSTSSGSKWR